MTKRNCPRCNGAGEIDDLSRAEYLKEARIAAHLTVRAAAEEAECSPGTITNSETRGRKIDFGTIKKLAHLYGLPLDVIPTD